MNFGLDIDQLAHIFYRDEDWVDIGTSPFNIEASYADTVAYQAYGSFDAAGLSMSYLSTISPVDQNSLVYSPGDTI